MLAEGAVAEAERVCARFGKLLPPKDGKRCWSRSTSGAADIPPVVRALDEAGIAVESLELVEPTLDDVFVAKTGHHLEEASEDGASREDRRGMSDAGDERCGWSRALGARSIRQTFRRPQLMAPIVVFPTLLLAIQTGGAGARRSTCPASRRSRASSSSCSPAR